MKSFSLLLLTSFLIIFIQTSLSQDVENIAKEEPLTINGSLNIKLQSYSTDKAVPSRENFVWYLQGSPVVTLYGITLPFSFRLSEQQREFRQPFNKFGVSPYYKWVKLHLGYSSLSWSDYALAGHSVSGVGFELTPGKFHVGFITGRLLKPVRYFEETEYIKVQNPAYKRTGSAFTIGYGDEKNNVHFVLLKAKDDSTSIGDVPGQYQLTPDENLVVSLSTRQTIAKNFIFDCEIAQSLYTKDMGASAGSNTGFVAGTFSFLMDQRTSTRKSNAFKTSFGYQSDMLSMLLKYERVDPDYSSMGAYYFLTDMRNITFEPTVKLMDKKLTLAGSIGSQVDNLNNDKNLRTKRTIGSARVTYVPIPQYNVSMFYSTYGLAQESGLLSIDTLRSSEVAQATNQFGITQSLNLVGEKLAHNVMFNFNNQNLKDNNKNTAQYSEFSTNVLMTGYFVNYLPATINGSLSYMSSKFEQDTLISVVKGPTLGLGKSFLKNKLTFGFTYSTMNNILQKKSSGRINTTSIQLGYNPVRNHRFTIRYYSHNNNAKTGSGQANGSYYENKLDFDYTYTF